MLLVCKPMLISRDNQSSSSSVSSKREKWHDCRALSHCFLDFFTSTAQDEQTCTHRFAVEMHRQVTTSSSTTSKVDWFLQRHGCLLFIILLFVLPLLSFQLLSNWTSPLFLLCWSAASVSSSTQEMYQMKECTTNSGLDYHYHLVPSASSFVSAPASLWLSAPLLRCTSDLLFIFFLFIEDCCMFHIAFTQLLCFLSRCLFFPLLSVRGCWWINACIRTKAGNASNISHEQQEPRCVLFMCDFRAVH